MRVQTARAFSFGGGQASFVDDGSTLCYPCGNTVKFDNVEAGTQTFLGGLGYGVAAVAGCAKAGLVVYAEKGTQPGVNVYSYPSLLSVAELAGSAELEIDAVAVSRDGGTIAVVSGVPDQTLSIWRGGPTWATPAVACQAPVAGGGCASVSICPGDATKICTISSAGELTLYTVVEDNDGPLLKASHPLPEGAMADGNVVTSAGWGPTNQLLVGLASGEVLVLELEGFMLGAAPTTTLIEASEDGVAATSIAVSGTYVAVGFAANAQGVGNVTVVPSLTDDAPGTVSVGEGAVLSLNLASDGRFWAGASDGALACIHPGQVCSGK